MLYTHIPQMLLLMYNAPHTHTQHGLFLSAWYRCLRYGLHTDNIITAHASHCRHKALTSNITNDTMFLQLSIDYVFLILQPTACVTGPWWSRVCIWTNTNIPSPATRVLSCTGGASTLTSCMFCVIPTVTGTPERLVFYV